MSQAILACQCKKQRSQTVCINSSVVLTTLSLLTVQFSMSIHIYNVGIKAVGSLQIVSS